jgi:hypothetical protein
LTFLLAVVKPDFCSQFFLSITLSTGVAGLWFLTGKIGNPCSRAKPVAPPCKGGWGDFPKGDDYRKIQSNFISLRQKRKAGTIKDAD